MDKPAEPDLERLASCVDRVAAAMGQSAAGRAQTRAFLETLLFTSKPDGGKEIWPCLRDGLITEIEARDLVMAHCATWLSSCNGLAEPSSDEWGSEELQAAFEDALFGRRADLAVWDRR